MPDTQLVQKLRADVSRLLNALNYQSNELKQATDRDDNIETIRMVRLMINTFNELCGSLHGIECEYGHSFDEVRSKLIPYRQIFESYSKVARDCGVSVPRIDLQEWTKNAGNAGGSSGCLIFVAIILAAMGGTFFELSRH